MHVEQMHRLRAQESLNAATIATLAGSSQMKPSDVNRVKGRWSRMGRSRRDIDSANAAAFKNIASEVKRGG